MYTRTRTFVRCWASSVMTLYRCGFVDRQPHVFRLQEVHAWRHQVLGAVGLRQVLSQRMRGQAGERATGERAHRLPAPRMRVVRRHAGCAGD